MYPIIIATIQQLQLFPITYDYDSMMSNLIALKILGKMKDDWKRGMLTATREQKEAQQLQHESKNIKGKEVRGKMKDTPTRAIFQWFGQGMGAPDSDPGSRGIALPHCGGMKQVKDINQIMHVGGNSL